MFSFVHWSKLGITLVVDRIIWCYIEGVETKHMFLGYILLETYHSDRVKQSSVWPWYVKVKSKGRDIAIYLYEFRDIDLVLIDSKHKLERYLVPEISYWMHYVMFATWISRSKVKVTILAYTFFECHLTSIFVPLDTKITFLSHHHEQILNNV